MWPEPGAHTELISQLLECQQGLLGLHTAASMYSVFLPFGAVVIDLFLVFMYFKHDFWLLGGATAIFALFPLLVTTFLLYSKWTRLKLVSLLLFINPKIQTIGSL